VFTTQTWAISVWLTASLSIDPGDRINKKPHDSLNPAAFFDWNITADINNRRAVVAAACSRTLSEFQPRCTRPR
jgi:hypothetical protein